LAATSEEIKRSLIHKILIGQYPVGATLPSCRDLAAELGINRNTASKIYQELAREGLVKAVRGRGVLVINQRGAGKATVPSVREHAFAGVPVVALHAPPDPDALLEIARLDPETRVGIVCSQETTLKYLATAVAMVHRGPVRTSLASDREALASLAQYAEVLIDSPSCHRDVARFFSSLPIVTVGFRIDVKSLGPLRDRLAQLISTQSIDPSTCAVDSQPEE